VVGAGHPQRHPRQRGFSRLQPAGALSRPVYCLPRLVYTTGMRFFPALRRRLLLVASLAGLAVGLYLTPPRSASVPGLPGAPSRAPGAVQGVLPSGSLPAVLWTVPAPRKVLPDAGPPEGKAAGLSLSACRGEREPCQLVLRPERDLPGLAVTVSDLQGPGLIPASAFTVRYVGLVNVDKGRGSARAHGGPAPDPLLDQPPTSLPQGQAQSIWLTALIPSQAAAGDYQGTVTITWGNARAEVPIVLHVYDFSLPERPALSTLARIWPSKVPREAIRKDMAEHRMAGESLLAPIPTSASPSGDEVVLDFRSFDVAARQYFGTYHFWVFNVPQLLYGNGKGLLPGRESWLGAPVQSDRFASLFASYVRQVGDHLRQRGWSQYAHYQVWDEPHGPEMLAQVRRLLGIVKREVPDAITYVTTAPIAELSGLVDIWNVALPEDFDEVALADEMKAGRQAWGYNNRLYSLDVDVSSVRLRSWPWVLKHFGFTGTEWWAINYWPSDPWTKPNQYEVFNGGGFFLYPNPDGKGVIDSLRWDCYRDGVDDYDYLTLLEQATDRVAGKLGMAQRFSGRSAVRVFAGGVAPGIDEFAEDPEGLMRLRDQVARLIEWYEREPTAVVAYRDGMLQGAAERGASVRVNDTAVTVGEDGRFQVRTRLPATVEVSAGGATKTLRLEVWPG